MGNKFIFWNFCSVVLINLTSFYFPIDRYTPLNLQLLGVYFTFSCVCFLVVNRYLFTKLLVSIRSAVLLFLIVGMPFISIWYTPYASLRDIALIVFYFLLVMAVAVAVRARGWYPIWRIFEWALILNIAGVIISFFFPYQFLTAFSGDLHLYILGQGRAPGLFVNGNQSSKVIILLMIVWCAMPKGINSWQRYYLVVPFSFVAIVMTGSRSALLVFIVLISAVLIHHLFQKRGNANFKVWKIYFIFLPIFLPILLAVFLLGIRIISPFIADDYAKGDSLTARIQVFASGPKSIFEEVRKAADGRYLVTQPYIEGIADSPIIGHGMRSMFAERYTSGLELISHNTFVTLAYEFGLLYLILFISYFLSLFALPFRKLAESHFGQSLIPYFVSAVFLFFLTIGTGHELRPMWCVLGALLGLMALSPSRQIMMHAPSQMSIGYRRR